MHLYSISVFISKPDINIGPSPNTRNVNKEYDDIKIFLSNHWLFIEFIICKKTHCLCPSMYT